MEAIKDFLLKQIVVRLIYTGGSFLAAHFIALTAEGSVQAVLNNAGVLFQVTDPHKLETYLTGILMLAAEFLIHAFHQNIVLPQVQATQETPK